MNKFFKKISRYGENPIAAEIAAKLHIREDDSRVKIIKDILKQSGNNKAIAINAIMPDTFDDTSINYNDAEIDDAILLREQRNKLLRSSSFNSSMLNQESEFGEGIYTNELDKAQHFIKDVGLIEQMEFVKRKYDENIGYRNAILHYITTDFSNINDILNGQYFENENGKLQHRRTNLVIKPDNKAKSLRKDIYYLKKLFYQIPSIKKDIVVYRCFPYGLLNYNPRVELYSYNQFLSTSVSKNFSGTWCLSRISSAENPSGQGYFMRITIPAGSRVIPLLDYSKFSGSIPGDGGSTEFELLLNNYGSLKEDIAIGTTNIMLNGNQPISIHHFTYIPPPSHFLVQKNVENEEDAQTYNLLVGGRKKSISKKSKKSNKKNRKSKKKSKKYIY
jgi:hypothetical protein